MSRIFFALKPDDHFIQDLLGILPDLQAQAIPDGFRWYKPENWHMTVHFIGGLDTAAISSMWQTVCSQLNGCKAFTYDTDNIALFPDKNYPHVLAITVKNNPALLNFVDSVERGILASSLTKQSRPFRGHITLARIAHSAKAKQSPTWPAYQKQVEARELVLIESVTHEQGPIYTVLERCTLV